MKKLLFTLSVLLTAFCDYSQSYLPLTGGTLTGPLTGTNAAFQNYLLANWATATNTTSVSPVIYSSTTTGSAYPYLEAGNLIIQSRASGADRDILFITGATPATRMTIGRTGNIGIGTTTPAGKLQVQQGTAYDLLTSASTVDIGVSGLAGGWARAFRVVNTIGSNGQDGGAFGVVGTGATPVFAYMSIPTADATGYSSTKLLMLDNSGNVGIGTTNTQGYKFAVNGTAIATAMTVKLYANWPEQKQEADHEKEQVRQLQEQVLNLSKALLKK